MIQYENSNISFLWTPEGRAINTGNGYDYEYFLKDQLGNTRVVFGMLDQVDVYTATMETELSNEESADFTNLPSVMNPVFNHTAPSYEVTAPNESAPVGGVYNPMGPAKYLQVSTGDKIDMEVWAMFNATGGSDANGALLGDIASTIISGFGLVSGEALTTALNSGSSGLSTALSPNTYSTPKSYLAYVLVSDDATQTETGHKLVEPTSNGAFDLVDIDITLEVPYNGHLYIYIINESSVVPVYFDDFRIVHQKNQKGLVVSQSMDYYLSQRLTSLWLAGLPIEGTAYINEGQLINQYLYQGKEYRTEDGLNLYDFYARQYDPALGRFLGC